MVIMGRKTYESIPDRYRPLPGRVNVVVTRQQSFEASGCITAHSWEMALLEAKHYEGDVFVIGGALIYELALPYSKNVYITRVKIKCLGDTYLPGELSQIEHKEGLWQREKLNISRSKADEFDFQVTHLKRLSRRGNFVHREHSRSEKQANLLEKIVDDDVCPFCPENILSYHEKPILMNGKYWMVTENSHPYENTRIHLLLIHKEHLTKPFEASDAAQKELMSLVRSLTRIYGVVGGSLLWRFGEMSYSGASVDHLHLHFVVGHGDPDRKVRTRIG
jgi:dihydrofolate reductase/diadenosine tetraphosphate (Ap4A) HIT family hydrolase